MTKYPLVFVTGIRSLFYHEVLGHDLQKFIAAHGYEVLSPSMPFRSKKLRKLRLQQWLRQQKSGTFHFILSKNSYNELSEMLNEMKNSTFTLTDKNISYEHSVSFSEPISYKLHRIFCRISGTPADPYKDTLPDKSTEFFDRFLDHCIDLAENEDI